MLFEDESKHDKKADNRADEEFVLLYPFPNDIRGLFLFFRLTIDWNSDFVPSFSFWKCANLSIPAAIFADWKIKKFTNAVFLLLFEDIW